MDNYQWTDHSIFKMKYYGLSQQRIKRVVRNPDRVEEGIVPKTIACMQTAGSGKHPFEIWTMYQLRDRAISKSKFIPKQLGSACFTGASASRTKAVATSKQNSICQLAYKIQHFADRKIRIISAWRYPGKSPKKNPIPQEILDEIKNLL